MSDEEKTEHNEFKKRIEKIVEKIEKDKEISGDYQRFLDAMEKLKQTVILQVNPTYRNYKCIWGFIALIGGYYGLRKDKNFPSEENLFQEEIDFLYDLIYQEIKKENRLFFRLNQTDKTRLDAYYKMKIINDMRESLGDENVWQFHRKFNIQKLLGKEINEEIKEQQQQKFDTKMGLLIGIPFLAFIFIFGFWFVWNFTEQFMVFLFIFALIIWIWFSIAKRRGSSI